MIMNPVTDGNNGGRCQAYVNKCKKSPIQTVSSVGLASAAVAAATLGAPALVVGSLSVAAFVACPTPWRSLSDHAFGNVQRSSGSPEPSNNKKSN